MSKRRTEFKICTYYSCVFKQPLNPFISVFSVFQSLSGQHPVMKWNLANSWKGVTLALNPITNDKVFALSIWNIEFWWSFLETYPFSLYRHIHTHICPCSFQCNSPLFDSELQLKFPFFECLDISHIGLNFQIYRLEHDLNAVMLAFNL